MLDLTFQDKIIFFDIIQKIQTSLKLSQRGQIQANFYFAGDGISDAYSYPWLQ